MAVVKSVSPLIHAVDPYEGFDASVFEVDLQGWASGHPIFESVINKLKPKLLIEVGTWKGASAMHMAGLIRKHGLDCELVCIDTFLGSHEHWMNPDHRRSLNPINGYPSIYRQFIANVIKSGFADIVTPFPIDSRNGALFLRENKIFADAIYIDACHDYDSVKMDLELYWEVLKFGGFLFGDDFLPMWHGVIRAVSEFADNVQRPVRFSDEKWYFRKPRMPFDAGTI